MAVRPGLFATAEPRARQPLVLSPRGHRIDRSDVGALLENMRALLGRGTLVSLGDAQIAATICRRPGDHRRQRGGCSRRTSLSCGLSHDTFFPLRVQSYAVSGTLIETVDMADAEIDVRFPEHFFTLEQASRKCTRHQPTSTT